jgi:hypothetical protein
VIAEITRDRQLAAVERGVAKSVEPGFGLQPQGDEIPAGRTDDDLAVDDLHVIDWS